MPNVTADGKTRIAQLLESKGAAVSPEALDTLWQTVQAMIREETADLVSQVADLRLRHNVAREELTLLQRELDRARRERLEAIAEAADWQAAFTSVFEGAGIVARRMRAQGQGRAA